MYFAPTIVVHFTEVCVNIFCPLQKSIFIGIKVVEKVML